MSDSTNTDLEHELRHLHGVYNDGGARRISPEGLRKSVEANRFSKPYWFTHSTHKLPAGARAYCSCCGRPKSEVLHWNLLALCRECVQSAFPEGPGQVPAEPKWTAPDGEALTRALEQRDDASDYIDALLDEVLGTDRHEWTSAYGYADAMADVRERMAALQSPAEPRVTPTAWQVAAGFFGSWDSIPVGLRDDAIPLYATPPDHTAAMAAAAEAIESLLSLIRRNAPELSGKVIGWAERDLAALRAVIGSRPPVQGNQP